LYTSLTIWFARYHSLNSGFSFKYLAINPGLRNFSALALLISVVANCASFSGLILSMYELNTF